MKYRVSIKLLVEAREEPEDSDFVLYLNDATEEEKGLEIEAEWWDIEEHTEEGE